MNNHKSSCLHVELNFIMQDKLVQQNTVCMKIYSSWLLLVLHIVLGIEELLVNHVTVQCPQSSHQYSWYCVHIIIVFMMVQLYSW